MAKYPVVVYGASGYTGMLIMDWLIDQNIPFTAVARDAKRVKEMMAQRVVRLESATYEIVEAQNTVDSLVKAFKGAKVVCNTVGPFVNFGLVAVEAALKAGGFSKLSIANPTAAPYGAAAIETMKALGVYDALQPKIVQGSSIAQAFQFVDTRNAEVGFVALSQLYGNNDGARWLVPQSLYAQIRQDAVLLKNGANDEAAKAFLAFLRGPEAHAIIERFGYSMP